MLGQLAHLQHREAWINESKSILSQVIIQHKWIVEDVVSFLTFECIDAYIVSHNSLWRSTDRILLVTSRDELYQSVKRIASGFIPNCQDFLSVECVKNNRIISRSEVFPFLKTTNDERYSIYYHEGMDSVDELQTILELIPSIRSSQDNVIKYKTSYVIYDFYEYDACRDFDTGECIRCKTKTCDLQRCKHLLIQNQEWLPLT